MFKVGALVVALVAISVNAAPLYQQQAELFEELLQVSAPAKTESTKSVAKDAAKAVKETAEAVTAAADLHDSANTPMAPVTSDQHKVYALEKDQIDKHNTFETKKRLVPFKVSAARDKAEADERTKQEGIVKKAKDESDTVQDKMNKLADSTEKHADKKATQTDEHEMTKVHEILHPKPKKQEIADDDFLHKMAKQAAGKSVIINADTDGDYYRPGGLGDPESQKSTTEEEKKDIKKDVKETVKDEAKAEKAIDKVDKAVKKALPSAVEMELAMPIPEMSTEETVVEDMRQQDELALHASQSMFEEALEPLQ